MYAKNERQPRAGNNKLTITLPIDIHLTMTRWLISGVVSVGSGESIGHRRWQPFPINPRSPRKKKVPPRDSSFHLSSRPASFRTVGTVIHLAVLNRERNRRLRLRYSYLYPFYVSGENEVF